MELVDKKAILRKRAKEISKSLPLEECIEKCDALVFTVSNQRYAIEMKYIQEVYPFDYFVPVPFTPNFILGVINFRGVLLSIFDLAAFFEIPNIGIPNQTKAIIVFNTTLMFGILTNSLENIQSFPLNEIQPLQEEEKEMSKHIKGLTSNGIAFLNMESLLSDPAIIVNESE